MKKAYLFLFALALLCAGCKPDVESCFTVTVTDAVAQFTSACSIEATSYEWEFGDGETSIAANPTHTYANNGTYTATLRVTDKKGHTATSSETLAIVACSVTCINGDCVNGSCACDTGYEGVDCGTAFNAKFDGTYTLTETCDTTGTDIYTIAISPASTDPTKFNITGLYREQTATVVASIGADGLAFTIASVDVGPGTIESAGTCTSNADGSTINVVYRFTNETTSAFESCVAVLTRQ